MAPTCTPPNFESILLAPSAMESGTDTSAILPKSRLVKSILFLSVLLAPWSADEDSYDSENTPWRVGAPVERPQPSRSLYRRVPPSPGCHDPRRRTSHQASQTRRRSPLRNATPGTIALAGAR